MKHTILVIGASGTVGSDIVKHLKAQGHNVREATSKKPSHAGQVYINLLTGEGRAQAFEGVDRAFFLSPSGYTQQSDILIPLIEEAKKHRLQKVVLMTAMGANAVEEAPLHKSEVALKKSGLNYNIIRPNWFLQNFHTFWLNDIMTHGKILLPAGNAKVSFIDARDISASAVKLLLSDEFNNQEFDLSGPEAIDHTEMAKVLSEVTGRKITYQEVSPEEFKKNMLALGVPSDYADMLNFIFTFLKQGYSSSVLDSVKKITGQNPIGVQQYARDYQASWKA